MSLMSAAEDESAAAAAAVAEIHVPAEVDWEMLDKSKFFFLGAALFSGVSGALYPIIVLKTRQQVSQIQTSCTKIGLSLLRHEGFKGFYRGFGTSLVGTIPARALYMGALEVTKSSVGATAVGLGFSPTSAAAIANAAAGVSSAAAAQLVWTPIDVVSQRLMVQDGATAASAGKSVVTSGVNSYRYRGGIDAFRKIVCSDGPRGLYRGLGISVLTYAPSNAVWWASYSMAHQFLRRGLGNRGGGGRDGGLVPSVGVQGLSAAAASGVSAMITTPLDTIKTRMQVLGDGGGGARGPRGVVETVRSLVREGGVGACYRGLGPRWASMSMSAATMVTTYEFLKRLSAKSLPSS